MLHHEQNKLCLTHSYIYICLKLSVSLNFWILSQCLVNVPQALQVNPACLKCNLGINLSPVNKNLLTILFFLTLSKKGLMAFLIFNKCWFYLPQTAQFDQIINLFCLVLLTVEFPLAVCCHIWCKTFPLFFCMK